MTVSGFTAKKPTLGCKTHHRNASERVTESDLWCVQLLQESAPPLLQLSFTQFASRRIPSTLRDRQRDSDLIWENETLQTPSQMRSLTSSFVLFLLGDFCLDSPRDFPLDLSFSLSFSFSLPFRSFSPSDSGEACKKKKNHVRHSPYCSLSSNSHLELYTLMLFNECE